MKKIFKRIFISTLSFLIVSALILYSGAANYLYYHIRYLTLTSQEKLLTHQIDDLKPNQTISLSDLSLFNRIDTICTIDSYAVSTTDIDGSLKKIFGEIDYSQYREELVDNFSYSEGAKGFYPVKDNKLQEALRVWLPEKNYIHPAQYFSIDHKHFPEHKYFQINGCHKVRDICLQKTLPDRSGWQPLNMGLCRILKAT